MSIGVLHFVVIEHRNNAVFNFIQIICKVYNLLYAFLIDESDGVVVHPLETVHNFLG